MIFLITLLALIPCYLIGSFPTGHLIAKQHGLDIKAHGSGNVGATNVARVVGKKAGLLTLMGDVLKGIIAVGAGTAISSSIAFQAMCAVAVVLGHCISFPPRLKGGKGVATSLGALLVLSPLLALVAVSLFAVVFYFSAIVSLASVTAALGTPLAALGLGFPSESTAAVAAIGLVVTLKHRTNLERLARGTEPKATFIGSKSQRPKNDEASAR